MSFALVFPGQGSQAVGMLKELAAPFAIVQTTFQEASAVLGYDLWDVTQHGPEDRLNSTDVTQPAMLTAGVACWRVWQAQGGHKPSVMAGHSLGEYSALVCAGALQFTDAIKLVAARGKYMQEAVPKGIGAMAAILGLDDDVVKAVCQQSSQNQIVQAVNFNSPGQVVVAGHKEAVERATILAKEKGAKRAVMLPVSVPSHCLLMKPAADRLAVDLKALTISTPSIPVLNNVDVTSPATADVIRDALVRQLYQPVRWVEIIQAMAKTGIKQVVECGPGKVLTGLNKRIEKEIQAMALFDPDSFTSVLQSLQ